MILILENFTDKFKVTLPFIKYEPNLDYGLEKGKYLPVFTFYQDSQALVMITDIVPPNHGTT